MQTSAKNSSFRRSCSVKRSRTYNFNNHTKKSCRKAREIQQLIPVTQRSTLNGNYALIFDRIGQGGLWVGFGQSRVRKRKRTLLYLLCSAVFVFVSINNSFSSYGVCPIDLLTTTSRWAKCVKVQARSVLSNFYFRYTLDAIL